jgi:ABC-type multidrug transport system fused ATPase/permease subunit
VTAENEVAPTNADGSIAQRSFWPSPLRAGKYRPVLQRWPLPATMFGFVWRLSATDQFWIAIVTVAVVFLDTVPIEVQRRIVNAVTKGHEFQPILLLALIYAGLVVLQGALKLLLNIYRSWISENSVRSLRTFINKRGPGTKSEPDKAKDQGIEISIIVAEADPVGSFVGTSISSPLQQIGILVSVLGYLTYLNPFMALATFFVISPQLVLVPLIQLSINRRVQKRVTTLRAASAALVGEEEDEHETSRQDARFEKVFTFNMGIFKLKYSLNFVMNLTHHLAAATILGLGGWYVINGQTEVGTVVAFVSGLSTIHDPWGDLVTWFQDFMVTSAKYDLIAGVVNADDQR